MMKPALFDNIICFGEVLWDMLPEGAQPGGAPVNVAIHLKKQGLEPVIISRIGIDYEGASLKSFLADAGLNLLYLQEDGEMPTSKVLVHLDPDKNAVYEICEPVAWDNIQYTEGMDKLASESGLIIFGTLASRNKTTRNTLLQLFERSAAVRLLDVNLRPPHDDRNLVESFLHLADLVKLNEEELLQIACWNNQDGPVHDLVNWLLNHFRLDGVCVTRGANGAVLLWDNQMTEHPGYKVNAVDTVGAGDAFLAAFIGSLSKGASPGKALTFASATSALVASRRGAVPDYLQEDVESMTE